MWSVLDTFIVLQCTVSYSCKIFTSKNFEINTSDVFNLSCLLNAIFWNHKIKMKVKLRKDALLDPIDMFWRVVSSTRVRR